ncbi:MAG: hypothetical protein BroJett013_30560 [Alphaproteobacteria bacterium]|nr:MAG: hypothetical protein BroJett013_30560 [Alphaproteobacteria bacterium]
MSGMALLFMAASTGLQAVSQLSQGEMERAQYNAAAGEAEAAAERTREAAAADASLAQEDAERTIGRALAVAGASGLDVSGSALDVLADLSAQRRYNTSAIIYQGALERRELLRTAANYRAAGKFARRQARLGALGTIISGGHRMTSLDRAGSSGGASKPTKYPKGGA